jgi:transposase
MLDLRMKRQQLTAFRLRHDRIFPGRKTWSRAHIRWLCEQRFEHPAHQIVMQEYRQAIDDAETRLGRLEGQLADVVPQWSMAPVVEAFQAMRGVGLLTAVIFVAEVGDVRRFESPSQLMGSLGLVPSERSTGDRVRRGGITKAGNRRARWVLIEGAWTYRLPARVGRTLQARLEGLPKVVRDIAWKAQTRLCGRYRRLMAAGKKPCLVTTAMAREMAAFLWAIGQQVAPRLAG